MSWGERRTSVWRKGGGETRGLSSGEGDGKSSCDLVKSLTQEDLEKSARREAAIENHQN